MQKTVEEKGYKITFEENLSGNAVFEISAMRIDGKIYKNIKIKFPAHLLLKIKCQSKEEVFKPESKLKEEDLMKQFYNGIGYGDLNL